MALFNVRVSEDLATRFDAWAAGRGGRSAALRAVMDSACGRPSPAGRLPVQDPRPIKLTVRLSAADGRGLEAAAAELGLTRNAWAAALICNRLQGKPAFSRAGDAALIAIQAEYRRIGVNVNQVARALNTAVLEGKVLELELAYLEELRRELRAHLSSLRAAFEGNLAYWSADL